jgi:RNase P subunit RPR2
MIERELIPSKCDKCQSLNSIPLSCFDGFVSQFEKSLIVKCKTCNKGFFVKFDESMALYSH